MSTFQCISCTSIYFYRLQMVLCCLNINFVFFVWKPNDITEIYYICTIRNFFPLKTIFYDLNSRRLPLLIRTSSFKDCLNISFLPMLVIFVRFITLSFFNHCMYRCKIVLRSKWMIKWNSEWMNEWMSERMNKWMNEYKCWSKDSPDHI